MTPLDDRDREIRDLFAEQRRVDAAQLPDYRTMRAHATAPHRTATPLSRQLVRVAAVAVFLAAGVIAWQRLNRAGPSHPAAVTSIASWKSPTAVLLHIPGRELLRGVPDLDSSILDRITPTTKSKESGS